MELIKDINNTVRQQEQDVVDKLAADEQAASELALRAEKGKSVSDYITDIENKP